jgi:nucleotide-binding universal stress UspA family protein
MLVTVFAAKWLAAESTRPLLRYSRDQARVVFGLSVPQAAATLAATIVGFEIGLFDDAVVNGAIVMILATCFVAPIIVDRHGRNLVETAPPLQPDTPESQQRILVACSTLASARPLIDLAVLLRDPIQEQPIYPVTVVDESENASTAVVQGERLLADVAGYLSAANVPAHPVTRVDLNAASGILRARRDLRVTLGIVGWRKHSLGAEFFFGSLVEQLLQDRSYSLLAARLTGPLNTCRRIIIAIPPHAEQEEGFLAGMGNIARLARQLGVELLVLSEREHEAELRQRLQAIRPSCEFRIQPMDSWGNVLRSLNELVTPDQLLVFVGVRPGGYAWRTSLGTLPDRVCRRYTQVNVLVLYLPTAEVQELDVVMPADDT